MTELMSEVGEKVRSAGRRAERLRRRRRASVGTWILGVAAAAGATALIIRVFPDMRRYLRIKSM